MDMPFRLKACFLSFILFCFCTPAIAIDSYVTDWQSLYPDSLTDDMLVKNEPQGGTGACVLCHTNAGSSGAQNHYIFSAYGWDIFQYKLANPSVSTLAAIVAVETLDSDADNSGASNIDEITAGTQPGANDGLQAGETNIEYDYYIPDGTHTTWEWYPFMTSNLDSDQPPEPVLSMTGGNFQLGYIAVGTTTARDYSISNDGLADLVIDQFQLDTLTSELQLSTTATPPIVLAPLESFAYTLSYSPVDEGTDTGTLIMNTNIRLYTPAVSGTGYIPACQFEVYRVSEDGVLEFGKIALGSSITLRINLYNSGTLDCALDAITLSGSTDFTMDLMGFTIPNTLLPGQNITLEATYAPFDVGQDTGNIAIASNDPQSPVIDVLLTGEGVIPVCELSVTPVSADFGEVAIGNNTKSLGLSLRNSGLADCNVNNSLVASNEFSISSTAPTIIVALGSATLGLSYNPVDLGVDNGTLTLTSDDPLTPAIEVPVTGSGITTNLCDIDIQPKDGSIYLTDVYLNTTATAIITVTNTGLVDNCTVDISEIKEVIALNPESEFSLNPATLPSSFSLAPGEIQQISIDYTPISEGATRLSAVIYTPDDPDEPYYFFRIHAYPVTCVVSASPLTLDFGNVRKGKTETLAVTLNNNGSGDCTINSLDFTGSTEFSLNVNSLQPPFVVPAVRDGFVTIFVDYAPVDKGEDSGTLTIISNDTYQNSIAVTLTGNKKNKGK